MKTFLLFLSLIILNSCANFTQKSIVIHHLDGQFQLIELNGKDVSSKDFIFNFLPAENRVFGETGCNGFSANFKQQDENFGFIDPLSTKKFCDGKMETENKILNALLETKSFKMKENEFIFFGEDKEQLFTLKNIQEVE
ncbi:MAG TPA: META domain-containing protein [Salinimicrobium sp.]|nr:META domain-containing protein [Salinimicrobium sp.]